ncbi:nuclear transport factor 2 family protein [Deefgea rivuli]|uniref:nuclear transport factor 2 family protein n=1 Tax=Deefgea rivuli TaxID=400948 RepID=UPI0004845D13|nr:DUF4440 domain-containing protein [Deefgea rivuli]
MNDLLKQLIAYEQVLHQADVRKNAAQLAELLHADFFEIGGSGNSYDRAAIIQALQSENPAKVWSQDYELKMISDQVALLIYKAAHFAADGTLVRHSLRSSLWRFELEKWSMIFHQGTPTAPFVQVEQTYA